MCFHLYCLFNKQFDVIVIFNDTSTYYCISVLWKNYLCDCFCFYLQWIFKHMWGLLLTPGDTNWSKTNRPFNRKQLIKFGYDRLFSSSEKVLTVRPRRRQTGGNTCSKSHFNKIFTKDIYFFYYLALLKGVVTLHTISL